MPTSCLLTSMYIPTHTHVWAKSINVSVIKSRIRGQQCRALHRVLTGFSRYNPFWTWVAREEQYGSVEDRAVCHSGTTQGLSIAGRRYTQKDLETKWTGFRETEEAVPAWHEITRDFQAGEYSMYCLGRGTLRLDLKLERSRLPHFLLQILFCCLSVLFNCYFYF